MISIVRFAIERHHFAFDHDVFLVCHIDFDGRIVRNGFDDLDFIKFRLPYAHERFTAFNIGVTLFVVYISPVHYLRFE